jgi:hypothetical protein
MKKTLRLAALIGIVGTTLGFSSAQAYLNPLKSCDFKQGMLCNIVAPSTNCTWMDGQSGACACADRDHYECIRF